MTTVVFFYYVYLNVTNPLLPPAGQWRQCCDDLMKIEQPSPRKPAIVTPKQGSLYHEMGECILPTYLHIYRGCKKVQRKVLSTFSQYQHLDKHQDTKYYSMCIVRLQQT